MMMTTMVAAAAAVATAVETLSEAAQPSITPHLFQDCEAGVEALTELDPPRSLFETNEDNKTNLLVMYYGNNCGFSRRCHPRFCSMGKT